VIPSLKAAIHGLFAKIAKNCIENGNIILYAKIIDIIEENDSEMRYLSGLMYGHHLTQSGRTVENALNFWNALLKMYGQALTIAASSPQGDADSRITPYVKPLLFTMKDLSNKPCVDRYPEKRALTILVEHCANSNTEVEGCLMSILNIYYRGKYPEVVTHSKLEAKLTLKHETLKTASQIRMAKPSLVLSDELAPKLIELFSSEVARHQLLLEEVRTFMDNFNRHRGEIYQCFQQKCAEILTQYRRWILPEGEDGFDVSLTPLYRIGIRKIRFYPEGMKFPDIVVQIDALKEASTIITYYGMLENFKLECSPVVFLNYDGIDPSVLHILLQFLIVDVMHQIVVPASFMKEQSSGKILRRQACANVLIKKTRPKFRRLVEGTHSTKRAHALMTEEAPQGWAIPDGMTYERIHDQIIPIGPKKSSQSDEVFTYTDDSFFSSFQSD
jgi:hypothetical protein